MEKDTWVIEKGSYRYARHTLDPSLSIIWIPNERRLYITETSYSSASVCFKCKDRKEAEFIVSKLVSITKT